MDLYLSPFKNTLLGPHGKIARFAHYQAGAFLALLIARSETGSAVDHHDLPALWRTHQGGGRAPDRTAARRVIRAVLDGLRDATGLPSAGQWIEYPARSLTTGPWRLRNDTGVRWHVEGRQAAWDARLADQPRLGPSRQATLHAIEVLILADERFRSGAFPAAVEAIQGLFRIDEALTPEGIALCLLRQARACRRFGERKQARELVRTAIDYTAVCNPLAGCSIKAEATSLNLRLDYDENPGGIDLAGAIENALQVNASIPDARTLWELQNTYALSARNRMLGTDSDADRAASNALAERCFEAAMFWLALNQDHYHLRAVCANRSHHLATAASLGVESCWHDALEWYRLSHTIEDRFDMNIDTALDSVFLAELWLGEPGNAKEIMAHPVLWIDGHHPGEPAFWDLAASLARQEGNANLESEIRALRKRCLRTVKAGTV